MCGICGIAAVGAQSSGFSSAVAAMNSKLTHRGPDEGGMALGSSFAIAMRRLAIIDIAHGSQPMATEDGRYTIVFNGEIYNFRELRDDLEKSGIRFHTGSDTEVILRLYREVAERTPALLKGMFAFAVWDEAQRTLFLARDRFGEKPLFYSDFGHHLGFSSEIGSLLEWGAVDRQLDSASLTCFLRFGLVAAPRTMFRAIRQVPPGCSLQWRDGVSKIARYYSPRCVTASPPLDFHEAAEELRTCLLSVVKRQMMSEVPLGALLSGGLDSSGVVAAMQMQSPRRVKTFTMRFEHAPYDESGMARIVAQHLGTEHRESVITNSSFSGEDIWRIVSHVGQPFVDSSAIPMFQITRALGEEVTVCLSGDGGDEMFAGYDYFRSVLMTDDAARLAPAGFLRLAGKAIASLDVGPRTGKWLRPLRRGLNVAGLSPSDRRWAVGEMFPQAEVAQMLNPGFCCQTESLPEDSSAIDYLGSSRLRQLMFHRINYALPEDMLVKVDRMSMANSVEVRAPLLDVDIADFSMGLPDQFLMNRGTSKRIWREAIRPWLPPSLFKQPKRGFSIPLHRYQNSEYVDLCRQLLIDNKGTRFADLFAREPVARCVSRGLAGENGSGGHSVYRSSHQLWALLQTAAWMQYFNVTV